MFEMTAANRSKYEQNVGARLALLATRGTKLAECSPHDIRWGIGHALHSEDKLNEMKWGSNQMGRVLSLIRDELDAKEHAKKEQDKEMEEG